MALTLGPRRTPIELGADFGGLFCVGVMFGAEVGHMTSRVGENPTLNCRRLMALPERV